MFQMSYKYDHSQSTVIIDIVLKSGPICMGQLLLFLT